MERDTTGHDTLVEMGVAKWYNAYIYDYFKNYLNGSILEIGCGIGNFIPNLLKSGDLTSIDYSPDYIKNLKRKYKNVKIGFGDIEKADFYFKEKRFDSAISLNVFEHIRNDDIAIKNTYNLLKHGGYFSILVPAHEFLFSDFDESLGHYRRYSKKLLHDKLTNVGFKVERIRYFNWWAAIGWFVFMKILRSKKMPGGPVGIFDIFGKYFLAIEKFINPPFGLSVVAICKK